MNKILRILSFLWFISILFFLTGCGSSEEKNEEIIGENSNESTNEEVFQVVKDFAQEYNLDESLIKEFEHTDKEAEPVETYTVYAIWLSGVKNTPNIYKFFDWWNYNPMFWVWWLSASYIKNDIACSYGEFREQEYPEDLKDWTWFPDEESRKQFEKEEKEFYDNLTYSILLLCREAKGEDFPFKEFYYNAQWWESPRTASIRWNVITIISGNDTKSSHFDKIEVLPERNLIRFFGLVDWRLEKAPCKDETTWEEFDYRIYFEYYSFDDYEDHKFKWCAKEYHFSDFTAWEIWTLDELIKKTWYEYTWEYNHEDVFYKIHDILNDYVYVDLIEGTWDDSQKNRLVLEKKDDWWKVVYEWNMVWISNRIYDQVEKYKCGLTRDRDKTDGEKEKCEKYKDLKNEYKKVVRFCNEYREYDKTFVNLFFSSCRETFEKEEK